MLVTLAMRLFPAYFHEVVFSRGGVGLHSYSTLALLHLRTPEHVMPGQVCGAKNSKIHLGQHRTSLTKERL
jgi:hypothetical protein